MTLTVRPARSALEISAIAELFREYATWLQVDANFPDFEYEMAHLPGEYSSPTGELFLALRGDGKAVGCVGVRPCKSAFMDRRCEMKRLYVRDLARGAGAGYMLAQSVITFAESAGYQGIVMDTLPSMLSAIAIYRALGFREIDPYYASPGLGALYFGKELATLGK